MERRQMGMERSNRREGKTDKRTLERKRMELAPKVEEK